MKLYSLMLALALDALLGEPPNRLHPVAAMGSFIRWVAARAPTHDPAQQFAYGTLLNLSGMAVFAALARGAQALAGGRVWARVLVDGALLKSVFSLRRLLEAGLEVETALEAGDLAEARRATAWHLVSRDTETLSAGHVASAAVESLVENLADSCLAPMLAFAVGGPPLAWAYRFANTADAMIGYHDERHEYLGKFAARLDDALNWLPARLSALLLALAAPFAGGRAAHAWRVAVEQHGRSLSPNAGWSFGAGAGALGVALEKIDHYRFEGGGDLPSAADIGRNRRLVLGAALLGAAVAGVICAWNDNGL